MTSTRKVALVTVTLFFGLLATSLQAQWYVKGDFNGWSLNDPLVPAGGNLYTRTLTGFFDNVDVEYRIETADSSISAPPSPAKVITNAAGEIDVRFWDVTSWDDGWSPNNQRRVGYVDHNLFDWEVMGSFNGWTAPLTLIDQGNGLHKGTFPLNAGTYQFKFRQQDDWSNSVGRDFGKDARNITFQVAADGDPWTFELDLPNGRWRATTTAPPLPPPVINGSRVGKPYGAPIAVQTVNTTFGDNNSALGHKGSELDAAYARIADGKLHLLLTGNLEDNFSKLVLFFDSKPGGQNALDTDTENFGTNPVTDRSPFGSDPGMFTKMGGGPSSFYPPTTFDAGFAADYALVLRHGDTGSENRFDVNYAVIGGGEGAASQYLGVFDPTFTVYGATPTGVNSAPIEIGFNNSNNGGVAFGSDAADNAAAAAVNTGVEIAISLADLGSPAIGEEIKVVAFINNSNHDYVSNQFLGGLPAPQGSLGSEGTESYTQHVTSFDLNNFAGDQFFSITVEPEPIPGDMNGDGFVNILDYVVWRMGNGTTFNDSHYDEWRANYDGGGIGLASGAQGVPEPTALAMLGGAAALVAAHRRRTIVRTGAGVP